MENVLRGDLQSKVGVLRMWKASLYLWSFNVAFRQSRVSGVRRFGWPTWSTRQTGRERFERRIRSCFQCHRLPLGGSFGS